MHMCRMSQEGWGAYLKSFLREYNVRSLLLSPHSCRRNNIIFLNSLEKVELDYILKSRSFFFLLILYFHFTPKSRTYLKFNVFSTFLPTSHFFASLYFFSFLLFVLFLSHHHILPDRTQALHLEIKLPHPPFSSNFRIR